MLWSVWHSPHWYRKSFSSPRPREPLRWGGRPTRWSWSFLVPVSSHRTRTPGFSLLTRPRVLSRSTSKQEIQMHTLKGGQHNQVHRFEFGSPSRLIKVLCPPARQQLPRPCILPWRGPLCDEHVRNLQDDILVFWNHVDLASRAALNCWSTPGILKIPLGKSSFTIATFVGYANNTVAQGELSSPHTPQAA